MRVLIVEDEVLIAEVVHEILVQASHQVIGNATSEERALEMASLTDGRWRRPLWA